MTPTLIATITARLPAEPRPGVLSRADAKPEHFQRWPNQCWVPVDQIEAAIVRGRQ